MEVEDKDEELKKTSSEGERGRERRNKVECKEEKGGWVR